MMAPKLGFFEGPAVLTAILALVAVGVGYVSLQHSTKKNIDAAEVRAKEQLAFAANQAKEDRDYSANQAKLDRLMDARQALYTTLMDQYIDVQKMFALLISPEAENSLDPQGALRAMGATVEKTWLLSTNDTARVVKAFYAQLDEVHKRLQAHVPAIIDNRRTLKAESNKIEIVDEERKKINLQLTDLHSAAKATGGFGGNYVMQELGLNTQLKRQQNYRKDFVQQIFVIMKRKAELQLAYQESLQNEQVEIKSKADAFMAAARRELGLENDEAVLDVQSTAIAEKVEALAASAAIEDPTAETTVPEAKAT